MSGFISGGKVTVMVFSTPSDAEMLGIDGKQVWYGDSEGLGSVTGSDVTGCFVPGSIAFGSDPGNDEPLDLGPQTFDLGPYLEKP